MGDPVSRDKRAIDVADMLDINYRRALGYVRSAIREANADFEFPDLVLACRELKEKDDAKPKRRYGVLPKGAGRVNCFNCDATAAADGEGSPIVLKHDDGCPEKYPIKDHRYDAGHPRDDSKGCIFEVAPNAFWEEEAICGRPLTEHAHSEYPEDYR